jgi:hypothetical protein
LRNGPFIAWGDATAARRWDIKIVAR